MALTSNTFTGDGSTTNYSFTFEYLEQDEVKVTIDGTATTEFTFATATTLSFAAAPADGAKIRIYRDTDIETLKATFFPGSAIKAEDLNNNFIQNNFAVQEIEENTWDVDLQTVASDEPWTSSDELIATTKSIDQRIDSKVDDALTLDIDGSDGITVTDDTPSGGQIVIGIGAGSVDLDRIKDEDILTYAEQEAGTPAWDSDGRIPTTFAAARRFDTIVQPTTPAGGTWVVGKTWLQNDADKTLSIWDGTSWEGISSGGTFTNQPKIVYVDASSGNDANDGHRISRPKQTIKAAVEQINGDATYGDGSVVLVAPGTYQETCPIDIQKANVSIIGNALRSCIIHPTSATETNVMFRVNSGSYLQNLTFMGMKASGSLGNTVDSSLPVNQGWNVVFYPGATIIKSPYIQNCTNFSDSGIDNDDIDVINPGGGGGGDLTSEPTGGGLLVDGSVVATSSPLRSMVCDSYTHVGLNGPGILITNNGYCQATSSYAFFNRYHIKCLNGGQANLAGSTTDFGDEALVADGKSSTAIFSGTVQGNADAGDIVFRVHNFVADPSWHGSATRPQSNMLLEVNGEIYPILTATAHGGHSWDVEISNPDPTNRSNNLGLNTAVSSSDDVDFYLRSMIASSGHTMEYVGSGTDYRALPENGGVPDDTKQIIELNDGKIWTAITDQNGKFKVGDFFEVDQRTGFISFSAGSYAFDVVTDPTPELGGQLDALTNKIVNLGDPTSAQDAATKNYVDTNALTVADIGVTVQPYDATYLVDADIDVTVQSYDADTVKQDVLPTFTTATRTTERTITAGAFDLSTANLWTVGAITVPNPTNAVIGQTGAIRITAGPVAWSGNFKFPGGTLPTIATFPAIIPFYVQDASTILMGNVVEGIA
jgi:hypothetical protein